MTSENAIVAGFGANEWAKMTTQTLEGSVIDRAFLAAHLLTGSLEQAESAVLGAIASWAPGGSEDELLEHVLHAAVRRGGSGQSSASDAPEAALPAALQAVLRLAILPRHCYVLRVLVGLPRQVCASLLRLSFERLDYFTCTALKGLPLLAEPRAAGTEYSA